MCSKTARCILALTIGFGVAAIHAQQVLCTIRATVARMDDPNFILHGRMQMCEGEIYIVHPSNERLR